MINKKIEKLILSIKKYAEDNDLVYLENDYFGTDSYYYSHKLKQVYKVDNHSDITPEFVVDNDPHVLELNNLPIYVKPIEYISKSTIEKITKMHYQNRKSFWDYSN